MSNVQRRALAAMYVCNMVLRDKSWSDLSPSGLVDSHRTAFGLCHFTQIQEWRSAAGMELYQRRLRENW